MPEHDTGVQTQSLYEYSADREFEFAGLRMPLRDLIELCPVKDDASRMTTEAIDRFTVKVYQASGEAVPAQFSHLLEVEAELRSDKSREHAKQSEVQDKPRKAERAEPKAAKTEDLAPNLTIDTVREDVTIEQDTEVLVVADQAIARETHNPKQDQAIHESIFAPSEEKLAEIVARYDAFQQDLQSENTEIQQAEGVETIANTSQKYETVTVYETPGGVEQIDTQMVVADESVGQEQVINNHEDVLILSNPATFEAVTEEKLQEPPVDARLDIIIARYETQDDPVLDKSLETLLALAVATPESPIEQHPATMTALMQNRIEAMPDNQPEKKQQAEVGYEAIKELAAQIAEIEVSSMDLEWQPETDIAELKDELTLSVRQLFELLDIPAEEEVLKHFVNRLIIEQLQEMKIKMSVESWDKGTHERKLFEDNLQWLKTAANPQAWLIPLIGRLAVA